MNRALTGLFTTGMLALLAALPAWCQKGGGGGGGGGGGSQPPSQPTGSMNTTQPPSVIQPQSPQFIFGRVLMENGQPVPEPVPVALICGLTTMQMVQSDLKGQFEFALGVNRANTDFSADNDAPVNSDTTRRASQGGFVTYGGSDFKLLGCELRVSIGGFTPLNKVISDPGTLGTTDVGNLVLRRLADVQGSAISVTSLMIPASARKEFEKGAAAARNHQLEAAAEHLEKAVAQYDKYAAAWNELGKVYLADKRPEDAHRAFDKAIAADPHYIPPYVNLASLELQQGTYENAAATAKKALDQDPNVEFAAFIEAAADYNLKRFDEAEKCARDAEQRPHREIPQLHALLADIYVQRQDYPSAAAQMRAYLKESPDGPFATRVKQNLAQVENLAAQAGNGLSSSAQQTDIAP